MMLPSISLVMLHMQADQNNGRAGKQAGNGAGAAGDANGIELLPSDRFDHALKFLKIQAGMGP